MSRSSLRTVHRAIASATAMVFLGLGLSSPPVAHAKFDAMDRLETARQAHNLLDAGYTVPWSDCTYYVSSALWLGGLAPTDEWTPKTSDPAKLASQKMLNPGPSKAAANADDFTKYMERTRTAEVKLIKWSDQTASGAELGDVIAYHWEQGKADHIDHLAIVTGFTKDHHPTVSQHSPTQRDRYWSWSLEANNWIEFARPGSHAYLIHFL